ncbi:MAG: helix-turn-helix domain-containing protein [Candidatus Thiodiazotropha sp.]
MIHAALFWSLPFFNGPIHYAILTLEADSAMPYLGLVETMLNVEISTAILHLTIYLWLSVRLLIHHDRPYLDSQLSLPGLAQQLDVSVNQLSQIINEQLQQNFFDFVNKYRIAEAKAQLQAVDQRHRNILTVATDVGFNSKTAFYTAFKKTHRYDAGRVSRANRLASCELRRICPDVEVRAV